MEELARRLLVDLFGPSARFHDGQWEAVHAVAAGRRRVLVVQRTGWGKSLVYYMATRLLREAGAGPTILISPLLSLMRNQEQMAERMGVRAARIDSTNVDDWEAVEQRLHDDSLDLLMISPERLANDRFQTVTLPAVRGGIGLFVVDEAHCISDWGHDFRPDYRRIVRVLQALPSTVPVLATTATANERVIGDIRDQFGGAIDVIRGPLARETLHLQNIPMANQAARLAWLAEHLPTMPGSGIVYCSTTFDCDRVSAWLRSRGIEAPAYHGGLPAEERPPLEQRLLDNDVKALVSTVALGMGFDKPDLGFVIHYQRPGSAVDYYQRIGRAGRAVRDAQVVLLGGAEDDQIQEYFIRSAFPSPEHMHRVLSEIDAADGGMTTRQLQAALNITATGLIRTLKLLEVDGAVYKEGSGYFASGAPWTPDDARIQRVTETRRHELSRMQEFMRTGTCLMEYLTTELDDPGAAPCGRCANCAGPFVASDASDALVRHAVDFLRRSSFEIAPRKRSAANRNIPPEERAEPGRCLSYYGDAGWGTLVASGKYEHARFGDELVRAAVGVLREWAPRPSPAWVTAVPSLRHPDLVPDFARRLAAALGLPFHPALRKVRHTPPQKTMENGVHQARNVTDAFAVATDELQPGPVLLVDDLVDSRWTFTECARVLRVAGAGPVHPFALATSGGDDE